MKPNTESTHTAMPWKTLPGTYHDGRARKIVGPQNNSSYILSCGEDCDANAALIVRAVNSHAELVEALRQAATALDIAFGYDADVFRRHHNEATDALASARALLARLEK